MSGAAFGGLTGRKRRFKQSALGEVLRFAEGHDVVDCNLVTHANDVSTANVGHEVGGFRGIRGNRGTETHDVVFDVLDIEKLFGRVPGLDSAGAVLRIGDETDLAFLGFHELGDGGVASRGVVSQVDADVGRVLVGGGGPFPRERLDGDLAS